MYINISELSPVLTKTLKELIKYILTNRFKKDVYLSVVFDFNVAEEKEIIKTYFEVNDKSFVLAVYADKDGVNKTMPELAEEIADKFLKYIGEE